MARRASRTGTWRWTAPKQRQRQARAPKQDRRTRPPVESRGHRKPTAVEIAARVNFRAIERTLDDHLAALLGQWQAVRRKQTKDLAGQIVAAKGDPLALASIAAQPQGTDVILGHLRAVARQAGQAALKEAAEQGATVRNLATNDLEAALQARSAATAVLLARALSEVAARKASQLANPLLTPESVAEAVTAHIEGLSDAWLRDNLNGALVGAQNAARLTAMDHVEGAVSFYGSALLDNATCLAPDVLVQTASGDVQARDVTATHRLLAPSGRYIAPSAITVSESEGELVRITVGARQLRVTPDHRVLLFAGGKFVWRKAGKVAVGDLMVGDPLNERLLERRRVDLGLREAPYDYAARFKIGGLSLVSGGAQRVPVVTIGLDSQSAEQEVDDPRSDLRLGGMPKTLTFKNDAHTALDRRLRIGGRVAPARAVASFPNARRHDAELFATPIAGFEYRWTPARLRAVVARDGEAGTERSAAPLAGKRDSRVLRSAFRRAVLIARSVRDGHLERSGAPDADLRDAIRLTPRPGGRVREVARSVAVRAVRGDRLPALFAEVWRQGGQSGTTVRPASLGAATAATARLAGRSRAATSHTRAIHKRSVLVPVLAVEREAYRGPVYDFTVPGEHAFLAEGVVVHNCGPCKAADGKRYATLADVAVDFPVAGRFDCLGTTRCRCMVVMVRGEG